MTDLKTEHQHGYAEGYESGAGDLHKWMRRAEAAEASLSEAREALAPFSDAAAALPSHVEGAVLTYVRVDALREARRLAALTEDTTNA